MRTVQIIGRVVTNRHTDALATVLRQNVHEQYINRDKKIFMVAGFTFTTRRQLAEHLLEVVNKIPVDVTPLLKVKSNTLPAFEIIN